MLKEMELTEILSLVSRHLNLLSYAQDIPKVCLKVVQKM